VQLRFASLVLVNLRQDLHPQECAHAGRTTKKPLQWGFVHFPGWFCSKNSRIVSINGLFVSLILAFSGTLGHFMRHLCA
jgi:hypothetical protein